MNTSVIDTVRGLVSTVRDDLRERRAERAKYQALRQELSTYRTANEIDDLLNTIVHEDSPEAQQMRDILLSNLPTPTTNLYRVA